jgi:hypothetical protein
MFIHQSIFIRVQTENLTRPMDLIGRSSGFIVKDRGKIIN